MTIGHLSDMQTYITEMQLNEFQSLFKEKAIQITWTTNCPTLTHTAN